VIASTCERAQRAIVEGAVADEWRVHAESCPECGFFLKLSRSISSAWAITTRGGSPLGEALSSVLAAACAAHEPLLGRWRLEAELGRGGQAEVYRATDLEVGEQVAVKLVRVTGNEGVREVALARRVAHAGVCRVFHTERFGELRLIVMELVEGPTMADAPVPRGQALVWWRQVCEGVAAAHAAGVLHLDLKPSNVLLRAGTTPVVSDFGLARAAADGDAASGGTFAYMAPEQLRGEPVDARADVFGLGKIGRVLLGQRPGRRLARVLRRATEPERDARYRDAGELVRAIADPPRALRIAMVAAAGILGLALVAALLVGVLPPPHGPRAMWREDLWGPDMIPAEAWNVARNTSGQGLPRALAEPVSACARRPAELLDGIAQYTSWEHGVAFTAPFDVCVSLDALAPTGVCGDRDPSRPLCNDGKGQLEPPIPCGERTITIELAREWSVIAVRHWHHGPSETPRAFRIEAETDAGWRLAFATQENVEGKRKDLQVTGFQGFSAPVTSEFPAITTRRVRLVIDTCTTVDASGARKGQGWLNEIEVFAVPSRWRAWWMRIAG
jgi:hypothetical protein